MASKWAKECFNWYTNGQFLGFPTRRGKILIINFMGLHPDPMGVSPLGASLIHKATKKRTSSLQDPPSTKLETKTVGVSAGNKFRGKQSFNVQDYLDTAGVARRLCVFPKNHTIFRQDDASESVHYVQEGTVKLTVVNQSGKEAVIGLMRTGNFLGEGCITGGSPLRLATATAMTPVKTLVIEKKEMIRVLHEEHAFANHFIAYMLEHNIKVEADLVDQLFNSSERRLARALLMLARYGKDGQPEKVIVKVSQETLAELVGTTRSRVNFFMNKFRKLGFIYYNGELKVHSSLLNVVLHD